MKKALIFLILLMIASAVSAKSGTAAPTIKSVTLLTSAPQLYGKVELSADIDAAFTNPYDPDDIRLDGQFTAPSGSVITVPGFYYRDYQDNANTLTATDNWSWRVRFTPTEVGDYHYQVKVTTRAGTASSEAGIFTAAASDNPGFIRLDSRNPQYFAFDNGTPYFPIGEDMGWSNSPNPLPDYANWLGKLSASGGNFVRVWMAPWSFDIEWQDTGLGNYGGRQEQAYQLDRVIDMLGQDHVYMMLSLLNHGQFSTTTNPEWDQNPFNAVNGGPCQDPACFATNPTALRLWNQRLRYIAARWGYSPNIFAWEWWNEVNWTPLLSSNILAPWIAQSAAVLRSYDPYHHLITHEGSPINDKAVWTQDTLDFTQDHLYNMSNLLLSFHEDVPQWMQAYPTKPFLIGEFGDPLNIDNLGVFLHLGLWSAPMNGSGGSGMTWYWDNYVDFFNLYDQFKGISAFFHGEDMAARRWQPAKAKLSAHSGAVAYGIQASDAAMLWIVNPEYSNSGLQDQYDDALRAAIVAHNRHGTDYGFEDGLDGWTLNRTGVAGKTVEVSTEQASEGKSSLALGAAFGGETWQDADVSVAANADLSAYNIVSLDIYAPDDATDLNAQVYTITEAGESDSQQYPLTPGQWNKLTIPLTSLGDLHQVQRLGVKIGTNISPFAGTVYIDNIRYGDQPNVTFSFKTLHGVSVNVPNMQSGSYRVEVWDTQSGKIIAQETAQPVDGTLTAALPDFSTDLALKIKPG